MSAIGGPDEHSSMEHSERSEQFNPAEIRSEYDPNYEPEREFVLMPLFRRIGEMLGLRRSAETEYVYEPEQSTPAGEPVMRTSEPQEEVMLPETAIQYSEPQLPAENPPVIYSGPVVEDPHQEERRQQVVEEEVLQLESDSSADLADTRVHEPAEELREEHAQPAGIDLEQDFRPVPLIGEEIADEPLVAARSESPETKHVRSNVEEWPAPPQIASTSTGPARKRNPEEIRQLVAPLREAAVKITAIVAQAAEWLRAKEDEFLRSAETIAAESKLEQESLRSSSPQLESPTQHSASSTTIQPDEVPAVQRELAWRERSADSASRRQPLPAPIQFVAKPDRPLATPTVPFWKRVNWAEEFTPKRVAVLGGVAMAVLLVLGISFARRPASSALPEQQTGSLEPGGVTVTVHPVAAPVPPQVLRKASATERPSPVPQHRSRRASTDEDNEPDVIVHHYDTARKPSPAKQTTVAGVRHYSDM